jgi:thiol-disulfide isomerase/thioredoxin
MDFAAEFENGLSYSDFLTTHGNGDQQQRWATVHEQVNLTTAQRDVLSGFVRQMKVLVVAGAWCGDCVNQCPIFDQFVAAANGTIDLRLFDRDQHSELANALSTCGGARVPSVLFLSEDNFVCGRYGDRTLAKYRNMAVTQYGAACPTGIGGAEQSLLDQVTQEWLNEFERIQLMLRLSGRLRQIHND